MQTSGKRERTLRLEEEQRGEQASVAGDALWPGAPFPRGELCKALSPGPGTQQVHNKACFSPSSTALGHSPGRAGVQAPSHPPPHPGSLSSGLMLHPPLFLTWKAHADRTLI